MNTRKKSMLSSKNRASYHSRPKFFLLQHAQAFVQGIGQLIRSPATTSMTLIITSIAISLPLILWLTLANFTQLNKSWGEGTQITLYLKNNLSQTQIQDVTNQIKSQPNVSDVTYISAKQGLKQFASAMDLSAELTGLSKNPIPPALIVTPTLGNLSSAQLEGLKQQLSQYNEVDVAQLDMDWVNKMFTILNLGDKIIITLAVIFSVGVIFTIGNTINTLAKNSYKQMEVYKLIGATNRYIRRPFLYMGLCYGILGGFLSWLIVFSVFSYLMPNIQHLISEYQSQFTPIYPNMSIAINIALIGGLLGIIGASINCRQQLKTIK